MTTTLTDLSERTDTTITNDGDHDRFQHYFEKKDIEANLFQGTPMTALCGKVLHHQVDPKGRTVCTVCKQVMEDIVGTNLPGRDGRVTSQP